MPAQLGLACCRVVALELLVQTNLGVLSHVFVNSAFMGEELVSLAVDCNMETHLILDANVSQNKV
jgi:hypothetical protein